MASHDRENCRELLGALSDYIDGELEARLCQEIEQHLAECQNCQILVDTLRKTIRLYQRERPETLPQAVEERLRQALASVHTDGTSLTGVNNDIFDPV